MFGISFMFLLVVYARSIHPLYNAHWALRLINKHIRVDEIETIPNVAEMSGKLGTFTYIFARI